MNKEQEQRLFNQIEEVLHTHEETYELGAWEEFDADRKKKNRKWPIYAWTAAAVILLCLGFGWFELAIRNEGKKDTLFVKNLDNQQGNSEIASKKDSIRSLNQPLQNTVIAVSKGLMGTRAIKNTFVAVTARNLNNTGTVPQDTTRLPVQKQDLLLEFTESAITAKNDKPLAQKQNKYNPVVAGAYDSLTNHNPTPVVAKKSVNKLTYSLVVSPSVSNQKMNFGAGMELSYNLGNRISINSGLMYASLNAKSDGTSLVAANSKSQGASLAVSGVELPLGIQYQTNNGYYASAGVSALGLIKDKLEYSFLQEKTVILTEVGVGFTTEVFKVVSEKKSEKSVEPLSNYMGFFNFSAGKKQALGNLNLNIGPFVKVPFASVSSEKIKLLQGGIKISVDF